MGLVKKASKLLDGVRRHKNEVRDADNGKPEEIVVPAKSKLQIFSAVRKLRRKRARETTKSSSRVQQDQEGMAQGMASTQLAPVQQPQSFHKPRSMADSRQIQIVEDEEDDEDLSEDYDESESEDEVDESVVEDMRRLEESFKGISQKYRLINRIGEGISNVTLQ
jgi:hypothetical protein